MMCKWSLFLFLSQICTSTGLTPMWFWVDIRKIQFSQVCIQFFSMFSLLWKGGGFREEVPAKEYCRTLRYQIAFCFKKVKVDIINQIKKINAKLCGRKWWAVKKFWRICWMQIELSLLHLPPHSWTLDTRTPESVATGKHNVTSIVCVIGALWLDFLMTLYASHAFDVGLLGRSWVT